MGTGAQKNPSMINVNRVNFSAIQLQVVEKMSEKIMVVGLDGATWSLLEPWISDNKLPTLKKIANFGSTGILKSTIPCTTIPAVPSLITGMNPGNHGIFSFIDKSGSPITMCNIKYPKIWDILDENNYSSCIVNVPFTFPSDKLRGVMISGNAPSSKSNYTYPESLKEEIKGFKDDEIEKELFKLKNKKRNKVSRRRLVRMLTEQVDRRYNIFKKLNKDKEYNLSIFWIEEADLIQHWCWEYEESLLRFYTEVDSILGDIILNFPDRNLFIVSDHGFESRAEKFFYVNTWLRDEGYLKQSRFPIYLLANLIRTFIYENLPPKNIDKILGFLQKIKHNQTSDQLVTEKMKNLFAGIDNKKSKGYLSTLFGIGINRSYDYEAVREEIIMKLSRLKDEKGENVIRSAWKKEEIYSGKYLEKIPDVIFLTSEKYIPFPTLTKIKSPHSSLFSDIKRRRTWWLSGEHKRARDGIFMAYGPDIKENDIGDVMIEDVCPTILHLMGCMIPTHVDGKVIMKTFKKNSDPANRKPSYKKYEYACKELKLERKEEDSIKERLRELGYI